MKILYQHTMANFSVSIGKAEIPRLQAENEVVCHGRVRDLIHKIAMEHKLQIISGKVARDHAHVYVSCRPTQKMSQIVQWLKGNSSRLLLQELAHLRRFGKLHRQHMSA